MKNKLKIDRFALHKFDNRDNITFSVEDYSLLKYGSGTVAKKFGEELAVAFFEKYSHIIAVKQVVVMESAYASIKNAASLITDSFTEKLNRLIVEFNGLHIERTKINRLVPYITDYGKLPLKKRQQLLKKDTFTLDVNFVKNKFLIFIDDIFITGTHQRKIEEMMTSYGLNHEDALCLYYAELSNTSEDPAIESYLNEKKIKSIVNLQDLIKTDSNYRVIVRTVKMILQEQDSELTKSLLEGLSCNLLSEIFNSCLSEGYYKNPAFSTNFGILRQTYLNKAA